MKKHQGKHGIPSLAEDVRELHGLESKWELAISEQSSLRGGIECPVFCVPCGSLLIQTRKIEKDMTLRGWIKQFEKQLSERDLKSIAAHKATIATQLKDAETANPHRRNFKYMAKDAPELSLSRFSNPDFKAIQLRKGKTWKMIF